MVKRAWGVGIIFLGSAQPNLRYYDAIFLKLTSMVRFSNRTENTQTHQVVNALLNLTHQKRNLCDNKEQQIKQHQQPDLR